MKNTKTLLLMLLMVVMSMGVKAQETQEVVVTGTGDYTGGTIVVNDPWLR